MIFIYLILIKSNEKIIINSNYELKFVLFSNLVAPVSSSILCQTSNIDISILFCSFYSCWATSEYEVFLFTLGNNAKFEKSCFNNCSAPQKSIGILRDLKSVV